MKKLTAFVLIAFVSFAGFSQVTVEGRLHKYLSSHCVGDTCNCHFSICCVRFKIEVHNNNMKTRPCPEDSKRTDLRISVTNDNKLKVELLEPMDSESERGMNELGGLDVDDWVAYLFDDPVIASALGVQKVVLQQGVYRVDFSSNPYGTVLIDATIDR